MPNATMNNTSTHIFEIYKTLNLNTQGLKIQYKVFILFLKNNLKKNVL